jgi:nitroreductase
MSESGKVLQRGRASATDRRAFLKGIAGTGAAVSLAGSVDWALGAPHSIKLPPPQTTGGMPVMEALAARHSTRAFSERTLSEQTLSDLLWAAFGINRPQTGDRTAPSWRHSLETDVYVATAQAVWRYHPKENELRRAQEGDIRPRTSSLLFVRRAPVVLIYVADRARMAKAPAEEQVLYAHVDSAIVAQNVYLFAASARLGTVILGSVDRAALAKALGLPLDQIVTFTQPVGYPQ